MSLRKYTHSQSQVCLKERSLFHLTMFVFPGDVSGKVRKGIHFQDAVKSPFHARDELMTFPLILKHGGIMAKVLLSIREIRSLCSPLLRLQLKLI